MLLHLTHSHNTPHFQLIVKTSMHRTQAEYSEVLPRKRGNAFQILFKSYQRLKVIPKNIQWFNKYILES